METDLHEMNNLVSDDKYSQELRQVRELADRWCRENNHEPILTDDGKLTCSRFVAEEHLCEPSKKLGIRPW